MADEPQEAPERLAGLSPSARRLLDYVAVLEGDARYAMLRHFARAPEPDMIQDLRETVEAGILAAVPGEPDAYAFQDAAVRSAVLAEAGEERLTKLRARAQAARQPAEDSSDDPA